MQRTLLVKYPEYRWALTVVCLLYLVLIHFLSGLNPEHLVIIAGYISMLWMSAHTRRFIIAFSVFVLFGVLYDLMKNWPNYLFNEVDISGIYHAEKRLFGFAYRNSVVTPNEYFAIRNGNLPDFLCGLIYLNWVPVPLVYAVYLWVKKRDRYLDYAMTFLLVNIIGFIGYYIHPAAPPWYVEQYGFELHYGIEGNAAGLARFDEMIGIPVFGTIYSRNSNVFAALPSLHCAYPGVMLFYGIKNNPKAVKSMMVILMIFFMAGIWFTAVYSGHHYVIDVILGILCAVTGIFIYRKILLKARLFLSFRERYYRLIRHDL